MSGSLWSSIRPFVLLAGATVIVAIAGPRFCGNRLLDADTPIPAFSLPTVKGERAHLSSEDLLGNRSVLFFWATWCPACKRMLPDVERLAAGRTDVLVVAIHVDSSVDRAGIEGAASATPHVVHVWGGDALLGRFEGSVLPTTYVVGPTGRVCEGFSGTADASDVERAIDSCR